MLFVTWVADPFRPTRDLDLLGYGANSPKAIAETFHAICTQPVDDDGVVFDVDALEAAPIREEVKYGGIRVRTTATIAGARIPIQVDIGFGDAITPGPVEIEIHHCSMLRRRTCEPIRSQPWSQRSSRRW
nr:nucleotidyl transferase AbiEii/AbiGii toxin family protein [Ensifer canadensis]